MKEDDTSFSTTYQVNLMKKGRSDHYISRTWRNRSFLLREQYLHYYDGSNLKGSINIANSSAYIITSTEVLEYVNNKTIISLLEHKMLKYIIQYKNKYTEYIIHHLHTMSTHDTYIINNEHLIICIIVITQTS